MAPIWRQPYSLSGWQHGRPAACSGPARHSCCCFCAVLGEAGGNKYPGLWGWGFGSVGSLRGTSKSPTQTTNMDKVKFIPGGSFCSFCDSTGNLEEGNNGCMKPAVSLPFVDYPKVGFGHVARCWHCWGLVRRPGPLVPGLKPRHRLLKLSS